MYVYEVTYFVRRDILQYTYVVVQVAPTTVVRKGWTRIAHIFPPLVALVSNPLRRGFSVAFCHAVYIDKSYSFEPYSTSTTSFNFFDLLPWNFPWKNLLPWKLPWKLITPAYTELNQTPWNLPPISMEVH